MISVYSTGPFMSLPDPSQFVLRVLALLRMTGVEHKPLVIDELLSEYFIEKRRYLVDGDEVINGSSRMFLYLVDRYTDGIDMHLPTDQVKRCNQITIPMGQKLYWSIVYFRWLHKDGWPVVRDYYFFNRLSESMIALGPAQVQRQVTNNLAASGFGNYTEADFLDMSRPILHETSQFLEGKLYLFGDSPTAFDATVYGCLAQIVLVDIETPLKRLVLEYENVVSFCRRFHQEFIEGYY